MNNMEYNSERDLLVIPEYGRNVQNLIRYARTIENREERQAFVENVVGLMMQMHPQNRNPEDYLDKMWKHVFRIGEYDLEGVMPPNGEIPSPEDMVKKPERIDYPITDSKFRHYGHNVQRMVEKALDMEDGPIKDSFVEVIASYMKLAYRTWNKDHYVSDDIIVGHLETLSDGKLKLSENATLDNLTQARSRRSRRSSSGSQYSKSSNYKNGHRGGGRKRRRR